MFASEAALDAVGLWGGLGVFGKLGPFPPRQPTFSMGFAVQTSL